MLTKTQQRIVDSSTYEATAVLGEHHVPPDTATAGVAETLAVDARAATSAATLKAQVRAFAQHCAQFRSPDTRRAITQIATTSVPFLVLVALMIYFVGKAYWLSLLLAIPAGGLLVRFFIIQHDCGHGSFLSKRAANDTIGRAMSLLTLTPYGLWRREHAMHHAGSGNLERRGVGDIETMTVDEYLAAGWFARLRYRVYRNPAFLFGIGVPLYFLVVQRSPWGHGLPARDAWKSTTGLNLAVAIFYGSLAWFVGLGTLLMVLLPIVFVASAAGGWLFFIQHQFEETRWDASETWDFQTAAVHGSSYYVLPKILQWFTGNIGLHHIHHLNSMVPNYRLQECMDALPALATINRLTIRESLRCVRYALWDQANRRLIAFSDLRRMAPA
jgi:acyl-lipid omega-6 desaturase (Delta-12 desaturase)